MIDVTDLIVAIIAACTSLTVAIMTIRQNVKINETHKQVSQNSHKNDKPTVLDLIAEVREEQRATNQLIVRHIEWHLDEEKKK